MLSEPAPIRATAGGVADRFGGGAAKQGGASIPPEFRNNIVGLVHYSKHGVLWTLSLPPFVVCRGQAPPAPLETPWQSSRRHGTCRTNLTSQAPLHAPRPFKPLAPSRHCSGIAPSRHCSGIALELGLELGKGHETVRVRVEELLDLRAPQGQRGAVFSREGSGTHKAEVGHTRQRPCLSCEGSGITKQRRCFSHKEAVGAQGNGSVGRHWCRQLCRCPLRERSDGGF